MRGRPYRVHAEFLLHPHADHLDRRLTVGCFPQQTAGSVEGDPEIFLLQSRQNPSHQERMGELRPQQDHAAVGSFLPPRQLFRAQRANISEVAGSMLRRPSARLVRVKSAARARRSCSSSSRPLHALKHGARRCRVVRIARVLDRNQDQHQGDHREDRQAPIERQREIGKNALAHSSYLSSKIASVANSRPTRASPAIRPAASSTPLFSMRAF